MIDKNHSLFIRNTFQLPDDYMRDYEQYRKGRMYCLLARNSAGAICKEYPRSKQLLEMRKSAALQFDNYVGEIDLSLKFRSLLLDVKE